MSFLVFDTETTAKRNYKAPIEDNSQPNLVQLAAILVDDNLETIQSLNVIVYPYSWIISEEVSKIHGITQESAEKYGVGLTKAVKLFSDLVEVADKVIAHNVEYDEFVMRRASLLSGEDTDIFRNKKLLCTMKAATNVVKVLHRSPRHDKDYKFPTLTETYNHFFGVGFDGAHNALADVEACKSVYLKLCEHYSMKP